MVIWMVYDCFCPHWITLDNQPQGSSTTDPLLEGGFSDDQKQASSVRKKGPKVLQDGVPKIAFSCLISGFMVDITIVNGGYNGL